jgi:hypothetical protein
MLKRLRQYKLYVNLRKYVFFIKEVKFLRFIISTSKVFIDLSCITTIKD